MISRYFVLPAAALFCLVPVLASAGTVTGVSVASPTAAVNAAVTVTVTGSNPCGAAFVDWGDGTAITYAITGLPVTQSHAYARAGAYPIVARGMGNCDGQASTKIEITGPPAPPPPAPPAPSASTITAVTLTPNPATAKQPAQIRVEGRGNCAFVVEYGDGNKQDFTATLPRTVSHTYSAPGSYRVIVGPVAPCTGKFTETLNVVPRGGTSITGIDVTPSPAEARQPVTITVLGSGTCTYTLAFGDGNAEERSRPLPDKVDHVYTAPDSYTVTVTASAGCTGQARRAFTVVPRL